MTLVFLVRNYIKTGTLVGDRFGAERGIVENIYTMYGTIVHWVMPLQFPSYLWVPFSIIIVFIVMNILIYSILHTFKLRSDRKEIYATLGLFTIVYLIFLLISASNVGFSKLSDRFLSPIYLPAMIIIISSFEEIYCNKKISIPFIKKRILSNNFISYFITIIVILWIIGSSFCVLSLSIENIENGTGVYSNDNWINSEILEYLDDNILQGRIYTNFPHQLYYFCGISHVRYSPVKFVQGSSKEMDGYSIFNKSLVESNFIVWLEIEGQDNRDWLFSIEEISNIYPLIVFRAFSDGTIYKLKTNISR